MNSYRFTSIEIKKLTGYNNREFMDKLNYLIGLGYRIKYRILNDNVDLCVYDVKSDRALCIVLGLDLENE